MTKATIFINGRFLTRPVSGVQRYGRELLRQVDRMLAASEPARQVQFLCLVPRGHFEQPGWEHIQIRQVGMSGGNLWEQAELPAYAGGRLLFSPANSGPCFYVNQVVTIHDASVFAVPQAYTWAFRAKNCFVLRQLARNARQILTDSQFSREELSRHLAFAADKIEVIALGSDHLDRVTADPRVLERHALEKNAYLLTVASQGAHKNMTRLFEALRHSGTEIKVVSTGGHAQDIFRDRGRPAVPGNVQSLGYVPDGELKALYQNARALVFPSIYEGFGLPVLEAMRCGCPVLCSSAGALPEVAGEAALYFDPYKTEQIARVMDDFLATPERGDELRARGLQQASHFEWAVTARRTLDALLDRL